MLRSYEPPSVRGTVSGLVPLHIDVSRPATPCAIIGPARLAVERGLSGSILSSRGDENSACERSLSCYDPPFVERTRYIVGRSARTLESGRLMVVTSTVVCRMKASHRQERSSHRRDRRSRGRATVPHARERSPDGRDPCPRGRETAPQAREREADVG